MTKRNHRRAVAIAAAIATLQPSLSGAVPPLDHASSAPAGQDAISRLRDGLSSMIAEGSIPNAQVIIMRNGVDRADFRLGWLDRESGRKLPEDAIFRLYSMTKPITTVAALMLVEEGKLAIDAPVARYLPEFASLRVYKSGGVDDMITVPLVRPITIGDLLTHSSGLTYNFMGNTPVQQYYRKHGILRDGGVGREVGDAPPARTMDELISRLSAAPLLHQPGERFSYGNSTGVLGVVIERVAGMPLDRFLRTRILKPLEMKDTGFVVSDRQLPRLVTNYAATADGMRVAETAKQSEYRNPSRMFDGGGALAGTAEDYLHFAQMLANGGVWKGRRLLSESSVETMFTPRLETGGSTYENVLFGYGLGIGDAASEAIGGLPAGAGGWSGSGNTYFFVDRRHGLVALLMTNELIGSEFVDRTIRLRELLDRAAVQIRDAAVSR